MASPLRILCLRGVGRPEVNADWLTAWRAALASQIPNGAATGVLDVQGVTYDDLFADAPLQTADILGAIWKLAGSGAVYGVSDWLGRRRALEEWPEALRWTAGMVAQWVGHERLRAALRERLAAEVARFDPQLICAHSLGSLMAYDTFIRPAGRASIQGRLLLSFGSQIGSPFVRGLFGGRLEPLPARHWYHLHNPYDQAFTSSLPLSAPNFTEVKTPFHDRSGLHHEAIEYLSHPNTSTEVWPEAMARTAARGPSRRPPVCVVERAQPNRRALLVGINEYPREADRLEGCVNDVFLISSVLQESGFAPDEIRVVLNERATAAGIRQRLDWLLSDTRAGDQRFFYYSGHGARIPSYGPGDTVDRLDECLVPHDFEWSIESAITDDQFFRRYSQLPYDSHFVAVLDCCHSGGMTRNGGARVRGMAPPDDILHRLLRWEAAHEMWVSRSLPSANRSLSRLAEGAAYLGESGATHRLGRAIALRTLPNAQYDRIRAELGHHGPYLPILLQACQEHEYSYEYRHGVTAYGAFTYALSQILRRHRAWHRPLTFEQLLEKTRKTLADLQYAQTPAMVGPLAQLKKPIPWQELSRV